MNPRKTVLQPVARGIDFVGQVLKPWRRTTRPRTLRMALQRSELAESADLHQIANSYFGLLRQATHSHAERAQLAHVALRRGHCVDAQLTKSDRRAKP